MGRKHRLTDNDYRRIGDRRDAVWLYVDGGAHKALIDAIMVDVFRQHRWYTFVHHGQRHLRCAQFLAHHLVMRKIPPPGYGILHLNGNRMDCRRVNLDIRSRREIIVDGKTRRSATGVPGVYPYGNGIYRAVVRDTNTGKWHTFIAPTIAQAKAWRDAQQKKK